MLKVLVCIASLVQIAPAEPAIAPVVTLRISAKEIGPYDPLVVQVVMENLGKNSIYLKVPFDAGTGTVQFERRFVGYDWHEIGTLNGGVRCSFYPTPVDITPTSQIATYEMLFYRGRKGFLFALSGKQELRAIVVLNGTKYQSDPVLLDVRELPKEELAQMKAAAGAMLGQIVSEGVPSALHSEDLARWESSIPASELKTALGYTKTIVTYFRASDEQAKKVALAELERLRTGLDPIRNDLISLYLADHAMQKKQWEQVIEALGRVKIRTSKGDSLRHEAQYWIQAAKDKK